MFERHAVVIRPDKGKEFVEFLHKNAKNKAFWEEVERKASMPVDKKEIDALFEKDN